MSIQLVKITLKKSSLEGLGLNRSPLELEDMAARIKIMTKDKDLFDSSAVRSQEPVLPPLSFQHTTRVSSLPELDGEKIAEAFQSEAAITIATDPKPVLATYGCGPCVAVGGYDPTNKIAFVVHFANTGEVKSSSGLLFYNISKLVKSPITDPIQLHLRGGLEGQSEAIIDAIKMWMTHREDLPMEIVSKDILGSCMVEGKSLSIDSRTGKVSSYDPLANPKHRGMSELDVMSAMTSAYNPQIKLAYSPK